MEIAVRTAVGATAAMILIASCSGDPTGNQIGPQSVVSMTTPASPTTTRSSVAASSAALASAQSAASSAAAAASLASEQSVAAQSAASVASEQSVASVASEQSAASVASEQSAASVASEASAASVAAEQAAAEDPDLDEESAEDPAVDGWYDSRGWVSPETAKRAIAAGIAHGGDVPGYLRCGTICGEEPTSGELQQQWYDEQQRQSEELRQRIIEGEQCLFVVDGQCSGGPPGS